MHGVCLDCRQSPCCPRWTVSNSCTGNFSRKPKNYPSEFSVSARLQLVCLSVNIVIITNIFLPLICLGNSMSKRIARKLKKNQNCTRYNRKCYIYCYVLLCYSAALDCEILISFLHSRMAGGQCTFRETLHPLQYYRPLDMLCLTDMLKNLTKRTGTPRRPQYVSRFSTECYNLPTMFRLFRVQKCSYLRLILKKALGKLRLIVVVVFR